MVSSCSMRWAKKQGKTSSVWVDARFWLRRRTSQEHHESIAWTTNSWNSPNGFPEMQWTMMKSWDSDLTLWSETWHGDMMRPCLKLFHNVSHCKERTQWNLMESWKNRGHLWRSWLNLGLNDIMTYSIAGAKDVAGSVRGSGWPWALKQHSPNDRSWYLVLV